MAEPPLVVLYEDAHLLAVDKPAGMLTQGLAAGEPTLEAAVRRYASPGDPAAAYLGTVHRLDRPVSGVMLWARTEKAARRLAEQFAARRTVKEYWALCETDAAPPDPFPEEGVWRDWLTTAAIKGRGVQVVAPDTPGARPAETRYRDERDPRAGRWSAGLCWLRLWPATGRTHQLRVQAAARRRPIWGDAAYGARRAFPEGIALHARRLRFEHPILKRPIEVGAPPPAAWGREGVVLNETDGGR